MTITNNLPSSGHSSAPAGSPAPARPRQPRRDRRPHVVVGVDGSRSSLQAVSVAAVEAERRGAPLRLVHVMPRAGDPHPRVEAVLAGAARVAQFSTTGAHPLLVRIRIGRGCPVRALLDDARDAALLVVGAGKTAGGTGPVAERLRRLSPRPLLIVSPVRRPPVRCTPPAGPAGRAGAPAGMSGQPTP